MITENQVNSIELDSAILEFVEVMSNCVASVEKNEKKSYSHYRFYKIIVYT